MARLHRRLPSQRTRRPIRALFDGSSANLTDHTGRPLEPRPELRLLEQQAAIDPGAIAANHRRLAQLNTEPGVQIVCSHDPRVFAAVTALRSNLSVEPGHPPNGAIGEAFERSSRPAPPVNSRKRGSQDAFVGHPAANPIGFRVALTT